jgi:hypothetical protein
VKYRNHFLDPEILAKTIVIALHNQVGRDLLLPIEDAWGKPEVTDSAHWTQAELGRELCLPSKPGTGTPPGRSAPSSTCLSTTSARAG